MDSDDDASFQDAYDYLEETQYERHELYDCRLSEEELQELFQGNEEEPTWHDLPPSTNPPIITIDKSKTFQWQLACNELNHIRSSLRRLLRLEEGEEITAEAIVMLCLGPTSETGRFLCNEIGLTEEKYLQFMATLCLQTAHRVSVEQLYHEHLSLLKRDAQMEKAEYVEIWKKLAEKRKLPDTEISTNRREIPLWETLESIVNDFLMSISIVGRNGKISVALDDDKIWLNLKNSSKTDLFNLKYTTHVKDNRKGLIAHTAVSSGVNIPLGICFERSKDSTEKCFRRLLDRMFGQNGSTNLRNVYIHSDRGYMLPSLVFKYLLEVGADVLGTVKRIAGWPFTYDQKLKPSDRRTIVSKKGASTLLLKWRASGTKAVFASAFRNGSDSVATAISTVHNQHHWEAIVLKPAELREYSRDSSSLQKKFFQFVRLPGLIDEEEEEVQSIMEELREDKIEPQTLRQGKLYFEFIFVLFYLSTRTACVLNKPPKMPANFVQNRYP